MLTKFRPCLESLEGRDVPAAFSFQLPDGGVVSGQFATPDGVDIAEEFQDLNIPDLTVAVGTTTHAAADFTDTPVAHYSHGVFLYVTFDLQNPAPGYDSISAGIDDEFAAIVIDGELFTQAVTYDAATTQAAFAFSNGTAGALSYTIPFEDVDASLASQSLAVSGFNLNIAGLNLAQGSASFTTPPTAEFEFGVFQGLTFTINTSTTPNFALTSISMSGMNITAIVTGSGQQLQSNVVAAQTALVLDFSQVTTGKAYVIHFSLKKADGTLLETADITISADATRAQIVDAILTAFDGNQTFTVTADGNEVKIVAAPGSGWDKLDYKTFTIPGQVENTVKAPKFVYSVGLIGYYFNGTSQLPK